jgi:hypothetical protein
MSHGPAQITAALPFSMPQCKERSSVAIIGGSAAGATLGPAVSDWIVS